MKKNFFILGFIAFLFILTPNVHAQSVYCNESCGLCGEMICTPYIDPVNGIKTSECKCTTNSLCCTPTTVPTTIPTKTQIPTATPTIVQEPVPVLNCTTGAANINLSWTDPDNDPPYRLQVSTSDQLNSDHSFTNPNILNLSRLTSRTYTLTNLPVGVYFARVVDNNIDWSNTKTCLIRAVKTPTPTPTRKPTVKFWSR